MFYSATLIGVRRDKSLFVFLYRSLRIVSQVFDNQDVARFGLAWLGGRTFRAFVLWKTEDAVQAFRTSGEHGKALREASEWLEWHAHINGRTENSSLDTKHIKHLLQEAPRVYFRKTS